MHGSFCCELYAASLVHLVLRTALSKRCICASHFEFVCRCVVVCTVVFRCAAGCASRSVASHFRLCAHCCSSAAWLRLAVRSRHALSCSVFAFVAVAPRAVMVRVCARCLLLCFARLRRLVSVGFAPVFGFATRRCHLGCWSFSWFLRFVLSGCCLHTPRVCAHALCILVAPPICCRWSCRVCCFVFAAHLLGVLPFSHSCASHRLVMVGCALSCSVIGFALLRAVVLCLLSPVSASARYRAAFFLSYAACRRLVDGRCGVLQRHAVGWRATPALSFLPSRIVRLFPIGCQRPS